MKRSANFNLRPTLASALLVLVLCMLAGCSGRGGNGDGSGNGGQNDKAQVAALKQQVTALVSQKAALERQLAHLQHQRTVVQRSWYRWLVIWLVLLVTGFGGGILLGVRSHRQWHQRHGPGATARPRTEEPAINGAATILHR